MKARSLLTGKILFLACFFLSASLNAQNWQDLFNGKDLSNWVKKNGTAEYRIEGNEIVGVSKMNTPNTFLCTELNYGDFILEFEVNGEPGLNSGVQIRSLSNEEYHNGRVHGYQVEIDPSERAWSGGIYDEARRGWLYPLTRNKKGQKAYRVAEWNHIRVEAIGRDIKTWINGVQCSRLVDDMTAEGFIALQVHGINNKEMEGRKVRWRNLRILTNDLEKYRKKDDSDVPEVSWLKNDLTENELRTGWRLLFDGESTEGWRRANDDHFPEAGWIVEDGVLTVEESGGGEAEHGGDIVTEQEFSNFELELDFMITEGANSGIKYFVVEGLNEGVGSAIGLEFQILDNERHPDAKKGVKDNRTVGSLYDLIAADNLSEDSRDDIRFKGVGAWNKARLVVKRNHVEHWLNEIKVVEYERGSQIYRNLVAKSKYDGFPGFGEAEWGHLLLQDHGNRVSFRSIKVREF